MKQEKRIGKQRQRRCFRVRNRIKRDSSRPRLSVFRSAKHTYAQLVDDSTGRTLAAASTMDQKAKDAPKFENKVAAANYIGSSLSCRAGFDDTSECTK